MPTVRSLFEEVSALAARTLSLGDDAAHMLARVVAILGALLLGWLVGNLNGRDWEQTGPSNAVAADANGLRARAQRANAIERALHLFLGADDADEVLHHLLQRVLHLVRSLAGRPAIERFERAALGFDKLQRIDTAGLLALGELGRMFTSALAEHQQV